MNVAQKVGFASWWASESDATIEGRHIRHRWEITMTKPFEIVFALYPRCAQLDFMGAYEILAQVPDVNVRLASPDGGDLVGELGVVFRDVERLSDIETCDMIFLPGAVDMSAATTPEALTEIRRLAGVAQYVTSVCTGSLILAQAGLLEGRRSACHWAFLPRLADHGAIPDGSRLVRDGKFMSGGGVSTSIDFALMMAAEIAGDTWAQMLQLYIEYAPAPPFDAGHPDDASPEVLSAFSDTFGDALATVGGEMPTGALRPA